VIVAGLGATSYYARRSADPAATLASIQPDSVQTELWSTDDGRNYKLITFRYSGANVEASRKALTSGLKGTSFHLQFEGSNYAYFAPSMEPYAHSIGWGLRDDGKLRAIVREYCPVTPIQMWLLKFRLQKGVNQQYGGRPFYVIDSFSKGSPERELMASCLSGDVDQAKAIVGQANLKAQDFVFWALMNDHLDIAQVLLDHGADINYTFPKYPMTTVDRLATCGYPDAIRFAFDHGAHFSDDGHAALGNLAHQSSPADHVIDCAGDAAFYKTNSWEKTPEIAEIYFAHGAKPNGVDRAFRQTPLAAACWIGQARLAKVLLEHGADPTIAAPDPNGSSIPVLPRQLAEEGKRNQWRDVVSLLEKYSAK